MPLPSKTLREVASELGIPENELRAMVDMNKVRAVFKKGTFYIAPDEVAKLRRVRKSLPESALKMQAADAPPPPKPAIKATPPRPPQPSPSAARPAQPNRPATPPNTAE